MIRKLIDTRFLLPTKESKAFSKGHKQILVKWEILDHSTSDEKRRWRIARWWQIEETSDQRRLHALSFSSWRGIRLDAFRRVDSCM